MDMKKGQTKTLNKTITLTGDTDLEVWDEDGGLRGADDKYGSVRVRVPATPGKKGYSKDFSAKKAKVSVRYEIVKERITHGPTTDPAPPPGPGHGGTNLSGRGVLKLIKLHRDDVKMQHDKGQTIEIRISGRKVWSRTLEEAQSATINVQQDFVKQETFTVHELNPQKAHDSEQLSSQQVTSKQVGPTQTLSLRSSEGHTYQLTYQVAAA